MSNYNTTTKIVASEQKQVRGRVNSFASDSSCPTFVGARISLVTTISSHYATLGNRPDGRRFLLIHGSVISVDSGAQQDQMDKAPDFSGELRKIKPGNTKHVSMLDWNQASEEICQDKGEILILIGDTVIAVNQSVIDKLWQLPEMTDIGRSILKELHTMYESRKAS